MDTPRLELVEITDEDAFFEEPPPQELFDVPMSGPKRPWLWCGAFALALALAGLGGFHVGRTHEVAVAAIAAAPPPPVTTPPVDCVERAPKPSPAPPHEATPPPAAPKRTATHVKSAPRSAPAAAKPSDPLTL